MAGPVSHPPHPLVLARPRLIAAHDIRRRISSAGLIHLKHFIQQRAIYDAKHSAEAIHQMRVAIRRLRTVIYVTSILTDDKEFPAFNLSLRDIARILGLGRDQDVFIAMLQQIPTSFHHDLNALEHGVYAIVDIRDKAYQQIDAVLHSDEVNRIVDHLAQRFQMRQFQLAQHFSNVDDADSLILNILCRRVMKRGRKLAEQNLSERHHLRIALKILRYGLEFLALDRSDTVKARTYMKLIERLLDYLGAANDAFTASRIATESLSRDNAQIHMMAGMIAGWHGRAVQDNEANLITSWQRFKALSHYWH